MPFFVDYHHNGVNEKVIVYLDFLAEKVYGTMAKELEQLLISYIQDQKKQLDTANFEMPQELIFDTQNKMEQWIQNNKVKNV